MLISLLMLFATLSLPLYSATCNAFFAPQDNLAERLISLIEREDKSIQIAVYCFTHEGVAQALIDAHKRGVAVDVIVDPFSAKRKAVSMLSKAQIPVSVWDQPGRLNKKGKRPRRALMHDKFCVFGANRVWTGSFNFTMDAALANCENAVFLDDAVIAKGFQEQFASLKRKGSVSLSEYIAKKPPRKYKKQNRKKA